VAKDGKKKFGRSVLGYDRAEVESALEKRDERLARLEKEAGHLAERVLDRERRLRSALAQLEQSEKVRGRKREEATFAREPAARPSGLIARSVRVAERVAETVGVGDLLEAAGLLPPKQEERPEPKPATKSAERKPAAEPVPEGKIEIDVGPLADFAQMTGFEDAVKKVKGAGEVKVERFSGGRAAISLRLEDPERLLRELERHAPLPFKPRSAGGNRIVLDVEAESAAAA